MFKSISLLFLLYIFNYSYTQNTDSINEKVIDKALKKAKEENKHVFINYFSTECKLSDRMKEQMKHEVFESIFNSNYIIVNIEVPKEETSNYVNCSNPMKSFTGKNCKKINFPFWYILNYSGEYTATSFKNDNSNIGFPNTLEEINDFVKIIRNTSDFSEVKINMIENSFKVALK